MSIIKGIIKNNLREKKMAELQAQKDIKKTNPRSNSKQRLKMKLQILHALENLLEVKEYSRIEVNDICNEAHISKPTFYRYFKNKDSIFTWMTKVSIKCGIEEIGRKYTWYEGYLVSLMLTYRHRVFYIEKRHSEAMDSISDFVWHYQCEALRETLNMYEDIKVDEKLLYQVEAAARTQLFMARKWCEDGMKVPPEVMAEYIASSTPHILFEMLNGPINRHITSG